MDFVPRDGEERRLRLAAVAAGPSGPASEANRTRRPSQNHDRYRSTNQAAGSCTMWKRGQPGHRHRRRRARGCSSMAEHQLPKLIVRVRFPSSAPRIKAQVGSSFRTLGLRRIASRPHRRAISGPLAPVQVAQQAAWRQPIAVGGIRISRDPNFVHHHELRPREAAVRFQHPPGVRRRSPEDEKSAAAWD